MVDKALNMALVLGGRLTSHNTIATKLRKSCLALEKNNVLSILPVSVLNLNSYQHSAGFTGWAIHLWMISHLENVSQVVVHRYQPPHCSWTWHSFVLKSDHSLPKKSIAFQSSFLKETVVVFFFLLGWCILHCLEKGNPFSRSFVPLVGWFEEVSHQLDYPPSQSIVSSWREKGITYKTKWWYFWEWGQAKPLRYFPKRFLRHLWAADLLKKTPLRRFVVNYKDTPCCLHQHWEK